MNNLSAINGKYQAKVNKAIAQLIRYDNLNNQRNNAEGDEKLYNKLDRQCENIFDKYLQIISELPKREVSNIENSNFY